MGELCHSRVQCAAGEAPGRLVHGQLPPRARGGHPCGVRGVRSLDAALGRTLARPVLRLPRAAHRPVLHAVCLLLHALPQGGPHSAGLLRRGRPLGLRLQLVVRALLRGDARGLRLWPRAQPPQIRQWAHGRGEHIGQAPGLTGQLGGLPPSVGPLLAQRLLHCELPPRGPVRHRGQNGGRVHLLVGLVRARGRGRVPGLCTRVRALPVCGERAPALVRQLVLARLPRPRRARGRVRGEPHSSRR
mmetsp:Transcript_57453/g.130181  ORF Transcript_57453/g.130181 Transcript_57453/m.130181 type:complete len:245 (-) Transcript_57453:688-1422(-)